MAFGKKKDEQSEPVNLFEEEEAASAAQPAAESADVPVPAAEPTPVPEEAPSAESPAADPLAGGADALLSLFQEDETGGEDRGAILDIAGEVELSDLLDDLRTLAVALRIDMSAIRS